MRKQRPGDAGFADLAAEEHVVGDRQRRRQRQVLVDGLDAGVARLHRRTELHRLAFELDFALVGIDGAGDRLDQRGFSGTVVADHGEDFAGIEIEIGIVERGDAAIALDETARGEKGLDASADTFLIHWSMATAPMMSTPVRNTFHCGSAPSMLSPIDTTPTIMAPNSVPRIEPRPPNSEMPPITVAVMAWRL